MDLYKVRKILENGKSIFDIKFRVVYYARVSTDREEQLNSLENQMFYYENFIKSKPEWIYEGGYIDEGISGTSVNKRNKFLKMIEYGKKEKSVYSICLQMKKFLQMNL